MVKKLVVFAGSIIGSFAAGAIGSLATIPNIPTWYAGLAKAPLNPPNWVFGPVWTTLYLLMGIALALVILERTKRPKRQAYVWFGTQLALNTLWSLAFFGLHSIPLGVAIIVVLLMSIIMTIRECYKINRTTLWLLLPYVAWVSFATYLTIGVLLRNS